MSIAGSDPVAGAGIQADLKTLRAMGVYGLAVPSVLTAQSTKGVFGIHEVSAGFLSEQLNRLLEDVRPDACKTGMLYSAETVRVVCETIKRYSLCNVVVDPVISSSTGIPLVREGVVELMKEMLFPMARVITPNIHEAAVLSGIDIDGEETMMKAAMRLKAYGPEAVVITGGHLDTVDLLFDGNDFLPLRGERVEGLFHGTGCAFSSAVAACLALGYDIRQAVLRAKGFVWTALRSAIRIGRGMRVLNV